jgi:putative spermidine/putrescine transport system permease protein
MAQTTFSSTMRRWLGVVPFFLFAILFLVLPSMRLFIGSFTNNAGQFTLDNILQLFQQPNILSAYWLSIRISAVTAIGGGILGFLLAYSVTVGGLPQSLRSVLITFSGVASNFAGVPLAFAFVATLGRTGFITALLKGFGINIYDAGFNLYSFVGLSLTYMYFQFPLMVLIMAPALDGLRREWREAAENLGATYSQYWMRVAMPILLPSILGAMILLFGNAFGAYATAYALTGGTLPIVTIQIGAQIRGDVLHNPGLGYAMAIGMVFIMTISLIGYSLLQKRTERWLK